MCLIALLASSMILAANHAVPADDPEPRVGVYTPIRGGWQIRITADAAAPRPAPGSAIGVAEGDCRLHRRPLYPPADRALIWTPEQLAKIPRSSFRPLASVGCAKPAAQRIASYSAGSAGAGTPQWQSCEVAAWKAPAAGDHDLSRWTIVDLASVYNDSVVDVPAHVLANAPAPPLPASQVNFNYWKDHFTDTHHGGRIEMLSDAVWRAKVGADGIAWTRDGIPFRTAKTGHNIAMVSVTAGYASKVSFPVQAVGKTLYLMISGATFPAQSHVPNLRVVLHYADGTTEERVLVNPFTIGDCWTTWCGRYHDTAANGFENLGGRHGVAGSADVADMTNPVETDTEAHLVAFDLKPGMELSSVDFEAVANDVFFGIMGATLLR